MEVLIVGTFKILVQKYAIFKFIGCILLFCCCPNLKYQKTIASYNKSPMEVYRAVENKSSIRKTASESPVSGNKNITKKVQNYYFNLNDVLGRGSFSTVYKGIQEKTEDVVAVKVIELHKIQSYVLKELLYSEIQILKSIRHPNILQCYQVFFSANNCYIITEYCNEGDVKSLITKNGPLSERMASKIVLGMYEGLRYLSKEHIIHRDIKTANVFIKNGKPKIADFGFAKRTRDTFKDINIGSPVCMSPEGIIHNIYGPKTDVWAFGIFLYELFHGQNIFNFCKTEFQLKQAVVKQVKAQKLYSGLCPQLKHLIISCLSVSPETRPSIQDLQFNPYIRKLQELSKASNIQVSQVQQFTLNNYDSKVSTDVPIVSDRRKNNYKKHFTSLNEAFFDYKQTNQSYKTERYNNKYNSFDAKVHSPKDTRRNTNKFIANNVKDKDFQGQPESTSRYIKLWPQQNKSNIEQKFSSELQKQRNSISLADKKSPSFSLNKQSKNMSNLINYKSAGTFHLQNVLQKNKIEKNKTMGMQVCQLQFQDLLSLLHYCRMVYKTIKNINRYCKDIQVLVSWLFYILSKIKSKISHDPSSQLKKLREILSDYTIKYKREFYMYKRLDVEFDQIQKLLLQVKGVLDKQVQRDEVSFVYVKYLYEVNIMLKEAMRSGDYKLFTERSNIQQFLNSKTQQNQERKRVGLWV